MAKTSPLQIA